MYEICIFGVLFFFSLSDTVQPHQSVPFVTQKHKKQTFEILHMSSYRLLSNLNPNWSQGIKNYLVLQQFLISIYLVNRTN